MDQSARVLIHGRPFQLIFEEGKRLPEGAQPYGSLLICNHQTRPERPVIDKRTSLFSPLINEAVKILITLAPDINIIQRNAFCTKHLGSFA
jgi:hypothetical protein